MAKTKAEKKKIIEDEKIFHDPERGEGIASGESVFATYKHKCKKCGYGHAEIINLGAQYSDENQLILLKCGRCGYAERIEKKAN